MKISERKAEALVALLFLLPNFVGFLLFTSVPVLASLYFSFTHWDLFHRPQFVGLQNFISLLGFAHQGGNLIANDPFFWQYLYNTAFLMIGIPFTIAGSLVLAIALNRKMRGVVVYRTIYFLPTITAGVAVLIVWKWLYNTDIGLFNVIIDDLGIWLHVHLPSLFPVAFTGPDWLGRVEWAKPSLIIMGFMMSVGGGNMILYLAALQGVPRELYEAANLDGASGWQQFRHITWPLISPTTFFIGIMSLISGFQGGFVTSYVMTQGGPAGSTTTIEYYIFNKGFTMFNMGYASAIAWFLFLVILVITLLTYRYGGRTVTYA
ncbi:MAG: sugar ABC transporter permease [Armatimonadetes bacterium]|nr:sugar ABC transporter permease [Armatimonadota bacterium]